MKNLTINDIAKRAGVSKSTASRVMNNVGNVREDLRKRVLEVIANEQYQPSAIAQGLSRQNSMVIGVLIPTVSDSFFGQILQGIISTTLENGYTILLCTHDNEPEKERAALRVLHSQRIRGLLITPCAGYIKNDDQSYFHSEVKKLDVPTVFIDRAVTKSIWDGVYYDNYNGAYMAIETLKKKSFSNIGYMVSDLALHIGQERLRGMEQAISDFGITLDERFCFKDDSAAYLNTSYELAKKWLQSGALPQAMFFSNNALAKGFMKAMFEAKLRVGDDIFLIGFDYVDILEMMNLKYIYLDRDAVNMGKIATTMLLDHFANEIPARRDFTIPAKIVINS